MNNNVERGDRGTTRMKGIIENSMICEEDVISGNIGTNVDNVGREAMPSIEQKVMFKPAKRG